MGRLDIDGLDFESEPVIRKMWAVKPGDAYRAGYPEMFLAQVKKRGVLDFLGATKADTKVDDQRAVVDVRLTFKGGVQQLDSRPRNKRGELEQPTGPQQPQARGCPNEARTQRPATKSSTCWSAGAGRWVAGSLNTACQELAMHCFSPGVRCQLRGGDFSQSPVTR